MRFNIGSCAPVLLHLLISLFYRSFFSIYFHHATQYRNKTFYRFFFVESLITQRPLPSPLPPPTPNGCLPRLPSPRNSKQKRRANTFAYNFDIAPGRWANGSSLLLGQLKSYSVCLSNCQSSKLTFCNRFAGRVAGKKTGRVQCIDVEGRLVRPVPWNFSDWVMAGMER